MNANLNRRAKTLRDLVEDHLIDSGKWEFVNSPHLQWVDLRMKAMGDGRAVPVGEAVQRQLAYEERGV